MTASARPPRHLGRSRQLLWAAAGLCALLGAVGAAFVGYEAVELRGHELNQVELYAKALDDKVDGDLVSAESMLRALGAALRRGDVQSAPERMNPLFRDLLPGRPYLRSLSLLDGDGRVLASSAPGNLGARVSLNLLEGPALGGAVRLGAMLVGRDLADAAPGALDQVRAVVMPMTLELHLDGATLSLVALINPDHFATQFERILRGEGLEALLLDLGGRVLESSDPEGVRPGTRLDALPIFTRFLPRLEHGRLVGPGADGRDRFSAFRVTRHWPLVVLVERNFEHYEQELQRLSLAALGFVLLCWSLVAVATRIGWRALRRDERLSADLTAAHAATVASESRKLAILQSSLDAIVTIDAAGRMLEFNAAAETMFGRSSAEVLGQPMHELIVPPHLRRAHVEGMERHRRTGEGPVLGKRIEIDAMRADGSLFPVELSIVPVHAGEGMIFTATLRDITERRRSEDALRQSRAALGRTGRIAGVGGWSVDLATHALHWTEQTFRIHDMEPGQTPTFEEARAFFPPHARKASEAAVQHVIDTGEGLDAELPLITATGRKIWVRAVAELEYADGKPVRLVGAFQDITVQRAAQRELAAARERELEIGSRIQHALLVTAPPIDLAGLQISSYSQASQGVDGDFVEVIRLGSDCIDIIAGDVMGKGMGAALMGAGTKLQFSRSITELLSQARDGGPLPRPAEVVAAVHRAMTPTLQSLDAFVTLCYVRIDTRANRLTWVGCGHEEPLCLSGDAQAASLHNQHPPLGVLDDADFAESARPWMPGDALFMCSDGVTDALRDDGERVGRERVNRAVEHRLRLHGTPGAVLHSLRRDLLQGGVRMQDDVTMVVLRRPAGPGRRSRIELPAELPALRQAQSFTMSQAQAAGLDEARAALLAVAVVEAFTNVVRHAEGLLAGAPIEVQATLDECELVFELIYGGSPFEPSQERPETDFGAFPEGGFGLQIIEGAFERVDYGHLEGINSVRMSRRLA